MNEEIKSSAIAARIWLLSTLSLSLGISIYLGATEASVDILIFPFAFIACVIISFPAFIVLAIAQPVIKKQYFSYNKRVAVLFAVFLIIAALYGLPVGSMLQEPYNHDSLFNSFIAVTSLCTAAVFTTIIIAFLINIKYYKKYFQSTFKINNMEDKQLYVVSAPINHSNKLWVKGLVTAALILLMLIPTVFVSDLVKERQARQQEVKNEVSSKWAGEQNITFPYLYIPYTVTTTLENNKIVTNKRSFIILPETLNVNANVLTQKRERSIYTVLLYNSSVIAKGIYKIQVPHNIDASTVNWNEAKICMGISDFKGLEQKVSAKLNNVSYDMLAGLPTNQIDSTGLSSAVALTNESDGKEISFELPLKIKGSDQLHFTPLAASSRFTLTSNWNSPSFDGNTLPSERTLNNKGFEANWNFINANFPFNTSFEQFNFKKDDYAFGVSLLQPTDQYAKTLRCIKYAILFIGLTFSLFFIVEIMQKKPFHPVQYVLIGLALVIFFTLLLSISEFLLFDIAYVIAAASTVALISLYAKSHFKSWKIAGLFAGIISSIYGFIFVLIRLEDTALLVGSIGLFVILALAMYASRKINWYGSSVAQNITY